MYFLIFHRRYVEQPFRNKKIINDKLLIKSLLIFALSIITISFLIYSGKIKSKQEGIPKEIKKTFLLAENNGCLDTDYAHSPSNNKWFCEIGSLNKKISFAIIGDSHALSLKPAFQIAALEKGKKGILTGFSGCPGLLNIQSVRADKNIRNCKMLNEKLFNYIKKNKIKKLFLVSRWTYYTDGNYDGTNFSFISQKENLFSNKNMSRLSFVHGLKNTFKRYKELNVEVFFVHQVPLQMFSPNFIYSKSNDINKIFDYSVDYEKHKRLQSFVRNNIKILKYNNYSFKEIDFDNFFCDNNKCLIGNITSSYYFDKNHLSRNGAKSLNKEIKKYLD